MTEPSPGQWHFRLLIAEAMLRLVVARLLVDWVALRNWRRFLGRNGEHSQAAGSRIDHARRLARAVERGAARLPIFTKCLPRAMALHWMMRSRDIPGSLVIGVLTTGDHGGRHALHAWVESDGLILIGQLNEPFHPISRFS